MNTPQHHYQDSSKTLSGKPVAGSLWASGGWGVRWIPLVFANRPPGAVRWLGSESEAGAGASALWVVVVRGRCQAVRVWGWLRRWG